MLCGLSLSGLSLRVSVALAAPVVVGAKFTDIVQDLNAASVAVQVVAGVAKSPASGPPIAAGRLMLSADD